MSVNQERPFQRCVALFQVLKQRGIATVALHTLTETQRTRLKALPGWDGKLGR